jgi:hypothetical protein
VRRIGVFVDYWYAYASARQLFAAPGAPPPPWFGNVSPAALAAAVVKHPPAGVRRSERRLAGLHVVVRHFDPEVHHGQLDRVRRWELEGATVLVGPSREEGGGHWQSGVSVALASAVVDALARGVYDAAAVFAGDGSLWPMFAMLSGGDEPSSAVELATWVGPDGEVPTALVSLPRVWTHRLGEARFRQLSDDRRPAHHGPAGASKPAAHRKLGTRPPQTAMAAALAAAGLANGEGVAPVAPAAPAVGAAEPQAELAGERDLERADEGARGVRRIAHRLFGRGA